MNYYKELPYYIRLSFQLLLIFLIGMFIYLGKPILIPLYFSVLLSILLLPLTNLLERLKIPRGLANLISVLLALFFFAGVIYFLSAQISNFVKDIQSIKDHLSEHYIT